MPEADSDQRTTAWNIDVADVPDGWVPMEVVAIVKCATPDSVAICIRTSPDLSDWEARGMLDTASDIVAQSLLRQFTTEDDGGEE